LLVVGCSSNSKVSDDIVARVNGKEITEADLNKQYQSRINGAPQLPTPEEAQALRFQLLTQMINDEILLQMASSSGLSATDAEVETKFTDLKSQYTEEKFQEMLKQQKVNPEDIKADMRKSLTLEKLVTKEITSRVNVSEAESRTSTTRTRKASIFLKGTGCSTSWSPPTRIRRSTMPSVMMRKAR
jgi:peptidyl-prolyl cis-trans isomerase SurA